MRRRAASSMPPGGSRFGTTHWSMVLAAGQDASPDSRDALAELCRTYWYPLYVFARRRGLSQPDAQDVTQGFFARLIEKNDLRPDRSRGRFRGYLLGAFKHHLSNEWDKQRSLKRGGGRAAVSLDFEMAETRYAATTADRMTPESAFEYEWAVTFLDHVALQLRDEYARRKKEAVFDRLQPFLLPEAHSAADYAAVARELKMSEGAIKVAASRMRERFRKLFLAAVEQTVSTPEEAREEAIHLIEALGARRR